MGAGMAEIDMIVGGTFEKMKADKQFNCQCCNSGGVSTEKGIIKAGEMFAYINVFSQYVKRCDGEFVIPFAYQTQKTYGTDPNNFKKRIKIHMICSDCFTKLFYMLSVEKPSPLPLGKVFTFKSRSLYYTRTSVSEKDYYCTCCGKRLPTGITYVRFGIYQYGCTCMECFKIFKCLE